MRWLAVLGMLIVSGVALRALLQAPAPQLIRNDLATPAEDTAVARGRLVYERYGCVMCHGDDGAGGRENTNAETEGKIPGVIKVAEGYTEAELRRLVRNGTPHIGREDANGPQPPYRMPGWGDRMSDDEVRDLVRYLFSLAPASTSWR